jgi:hypothetical protein
MLDVFRRPAFFRTTRTSPRIRQYPVLHCTHRSQSKPRAVLADADRLNPPGYSVERTQRDAWWRMACLRKRLLNRAGHVCLFMSPPPPVHVRTHVRGTSTTRETLASPDATALDYSYRYSIAEEQSTCCKVNGAV